MRRHYIFTDKRESKRGYCQQCWGNVPDFCFPDRLFYLAESWDGICALRRGDTAVPDFSVAGLVIGIMAKLEEDKFYLFAWIGIVLNALTLLGIGGIVAVGVYGL